MMPKFEGTEAHPIHNPFHHGTLTKALKDLHALDQVNLFHGDPNLKNICLTRTQTQWIDFGDTQPSSPWKSPHGFPSPPFFIHPLLGMSNLAMFQAKTLPFYWLASVNDTPPPLNQLKTFANTPCVKKTLHTFLRSRATLQHEALKHGPKLPVQSEAMHAAQTYTRIYGMVWYRPKLKKAFYTLEFLKTLTTGTYLKARIAKTIERNPENSHQLETKAREYAKTYHQATQALSGLGLPQTPVVKAWTKLEQTQSTFLVNARIQ
ncbi:MAG: hypothetical protein ACKO37_02565 [Vampirovibrionales bacterium]